MKITYEYRPNLDRMGPVKLVESFEGLVGFRSVYAFLEDATKLIIETGRTAGLAGLNLYADQMFFDFDNQPDAAFNLSRQLITNNVEHRVYNSGGRSIHLHVTTVPTISKHLPKIHKKWAEQNAPLADMSIYKTSGIYRLEGTFHAKYPGRKKTLLYEMFGNKLEFTDWQEPIPLAINTRDPEGDEYSDKIRMLYVMLQRDVDQGTKGRNNHIFQIASLCRELNSPFDEALQMCNDWNLKHCTPQLEYRGIYATVRSAYSYAK